MEEIGAWQRVDQVAAVDIEAVYPLYYIKSNIALFKGILIFKFLWNSCALSI